MTDIVEVASGSVEIVEVASGSVEIVEIAVQGPPGVDADHSGLLNLDADDHLQYHTDARGDARYAALAHDHSGVYEPADADLQAHLISTSNPHSVTAAQVGADATGTAAGLIATHEAALDPHPGYLTPTEGDAAYAALSHDHSGVYEASGAVSTHAAVTSSVHGITTFGASLVDDADAGTARNTLGLGTAATTAATDYATAAHNHTGTYDPAGTASSAVSSHEGAADPHPGYALESSLGGAALLSVGTTAGTVAAGDHAHAASAITSGTVDTARLGSGTANSSTYLRGDQTWAAAAGGVASDTHAATEKTTPVDADELPLIDSAASWVLKRLTWANVKATLAGVFPLLAGQSGGQTLMGGTGVTDRLVLQGTSGNGTSTATALEVKVGNNGALTALTVSNNGQLTIQGDATTDLPTYGSELLSSAGWTVNTGWTESPDDVFAHSSGTDVLTHSATITNGYKYQISWTITGRTAGSITIAVGGQSNASATATGTWGPTATSTAAFTITPTTDFNGTLSLVSLKRITAGSTPERVVKDSSGAVICEERFVGSNVSLGYQAGYSITTGVSNNCFGYQAGYSITTGVSNNCFGTNAGRSITTGGNNNCFGYQAGYSITTGVSNNCFGNNAGRSITTGRYDNCLGYQTGYSITTGSYNNCLGYQAGRHHADGSTALTDPEYSIYIGYNARGLDNSDNNSVVIGGNTPIGLGANTTVIGTSATTLTRLFGNLGLGVDSPNAAIHAIKTTEQLRLGYDASNYASFTVSSAGNLTIDAVGGTIYTPDTIENTVNGGGVVLRSSNGTRYMITVTDAGTLSVSAA